MYGKIFDSIYDGTLRANWKALVTFQQFIILAGPDGIVDMTPHAIHGRTGIPLDIIEEGIKHLSAPDQYSRSPHEEGRRIVLIDQARPWGWRIVNHDYYKKLITRDDKRKADRDRVAAKREEEKSIKTNVSQLVANGSEQSQNVESVADVAHSYSDAYSDSDTKQITTLSGKPDAVPQEKKKANLKADAIEVLNFLNAKTGRAYRPVSTNLDLIINRLKSGTSVQDCKTMIARMHREWGNDDKMKKYLRPATLFNATKFEQYIGECV